MQLPEQQKKINGASSTTPSIRHHHVHHYYKFHHYTLHLKVASSESLYHKILDLLLDTRGLEVQYIKEVLSEVKQWESMPNYR